MIAISPFDPDKPIYVVSDLHLGDGTDKDNFRPYRHHFERFLDELEPGTQLVLAGDAFEFWQCQHGAIVREYLDLLRRLVEMKAILVVGNHDIDLLGFVELGTGDPITALLRKHLTLERGGRTIRICHGHEFDKFNDPKRWLFLGRVATILAGQVEIRIGPEIGGQPTEKFLEKVISAIGRWLMRCYRRFNKTPAESRKKRNEHLTGLLAFKQNNPKIDVIVAGHTHEAGTYEEWYVNTGSWQCENGAGYAVIGPDGTVELKRPDGTPIRHALWQDKPPTAKQERNRHSQQKEREEPL